MLEKNQQQQSRKKIERFVVETLVEIKKGKKGRFSVQAIWNSGQFKHYPKSVATSETILYAAKVWDQSQSNG